jgi:hypothetical protein
VSGDAGAVRALVADFAASPYAGGTVAALTPALAGNDREYRGLVALDEDRIIGVVVYGTTAGAEGAGRLYFVATDRSERPRENGIALVEATVGALRESGHRFVAVEVADDPAFGPLRSLLAECGFRAETTVRDFFRDGISLTILRRDLPLR